MARTKKSERAVTIEDCTWIKARPARVFKALTDGKDLSRWWPKGAESDPRRGGKLVLTWFSGHRLSTNFSSFIRNREVAYPFYSESVRFRLSAKKGGTAVRVAHRCSTDACVHVAQSWGFLMGNLKCYLEYDGDLRCE